MTKRRTAEEVFNMPDPVKRFIDHGVSAARGTRKGETANGKAEENPKVIELDESRSALTTLSTASDQSHTDPGLHQGQSVDLARTYAKARIQKRSDSSPS